MGINNQGHDAAQSSQAKGKEMLVVQLFGEAPPKPKKSSSNSNMEFNLPQKQYSFKDE